MTQAAPDPAPFVVGVGRSGTTLLRLMLDAHPALAIPGETQFIPPLADTVERGAGPGDVLDLLTGAQTWPNLGLDPAVVGPALAALEPFTTAGAVRTVFGLYAARFGKTRWGDKTPTYRQQLAQIGRSVPEARFIHIIRDGRDVALSYRGLWFGPGDDLEAQARFWTGEIAEARRQARQVSHYMELRYEDLIRAPEAELRRICDFIDLPYDPAMLSYSVRARERMAEYVQTFGPAGPGTVPRERFLAIHDRTQAPPDESRIERWRGEMSADECVRYEAIAAPLLAELGYSLMAEAVALQR